MNTTIGLLTDNNFTLIYDNSFKKYQHDISSYINISVLIDKCREYDVTNIWVTPYSEISGLFTSTFFETTDDYGIKVNRVEDNVECSKYLKVYKKDKLDDISITIPEYNHLWAFNEYEDISPNDLATMLITLRDKLPVPIFNSPTKIGTMLLEELTPNENKYWLRHSDFTLGDITLATNLIWRCKKKPTPKLYLHVYDKNGSYLSAYQSCLLGSGNATHFNTIPFDSSKVGVWNVTISGDSIYNDIDLPIPYNQFSNSWLWTPEIKIASMLGYDNITVNECWLWKDSHYIFREWASFLWNVREELKQLWLETNKVGYQLAYDSIKKIYTQTGGRLAFRGIDFNTSDIFHRDDWFSMIVSDARLKVLYQVNKLVKMGYFPVMILNDALYYLSDEINPMRAIPSIMDRSTSLGGFKHKYSIEYSKVQNLFEIFSSPNKIAELLNQLERNGETW